MASSPNAVDAAVMAVLATDATLMALLPDGVWMEAAKPGAKRFVVVEPLEHDDTYGFTETLYERYVYAVRAVALATDGALVMSGADRIQELLQEVPLTVPGYSWMTTLRLRRAREAELDAVDTDARFQHRGGHYEVWLSPE